MHLFERVALRQRVRVLSANLLSRLLNVDLFVIYISIACYQQLIIRLLWTCGLNASPRRERAAGRAARPPRRASARTCCRVFPAPFLVVWCVAEHAGSGYRVQTLGGLSRSPPARSTFACQPHLQPALALHSSAACCCCSARRRSLASARDRSLANSVSAIRIRNHA